jgi:hypothetical protein
MSSGKQTEENAVKITVPVQDPKKPGEGDDPDEKKAPPPPAETAGFERKEEKKKDVVRGRSCSSSVHGE